LRCFYNEDLLHFLPICLRYVCASVHLSMFTFNKKRVMHWLTAFSRTACFVDYLVSHLKRLVKLAVIICNIGAVRQCLDHYCSACDWRQFFEPFLMECVAFHLLNILDQRFRSRCMHILMEIIVVMLFLSRGASIVNWPRSCIDNARVKHSVKYAPAHPKVFQLIYGLDSRGVNSCEIILDAPS